MHQTNIQAVIVTHHPNEDHLIALIKSLAPQVSHILVIDNNSKSFPTLESQFNSSKVKVRINSENIGLAAAYNIGIADAQQSGCTHLILFDQDSMPTSDMVDKLLQALLARNSASLCVAAAGPKYSDIKSQSQSPFVRIKGFQLERVPCLENEIVEIDHLISSGSLIDLRAIDLIGNFADELFIDCVDTEWCLRARRHGLIILGVGSALMKHNIGDAHFTVMRKQIPLHSPLRNYYQIRNQIWLIKQTWVGWRWRIIDTLRCCKLIIAFTVFAPNRADRLLFISKGIFDGIFSRMGRYRA